MRPADEVPASNDVAEAAATINSPPPVEGWKSPVQGFSPLQPAELGTFCETWKVREDATGQVFALKCLRPEFCDDEDARQLLRNEAIAGQAVRGRHVVRVVESDQQAAAPFNLLEWLDGCSLEVSLSNGRLPLVGTVVWYARQCAQGLGELARAGFAHGDVKPENIFLMHGGEVKLIDLGFARPLDETFVSASNCLTGTPEYMAPECCLRGPCNQQLSDMYSLGVVLYRLLAGRLPFEAATTEEVLRLHAGSRPPALRDLSAAASDDLIKLVERLLAKQPVRRPQSYSSLIRELTAIELATLHARFAA